MSSYTRSSKTRYYTKQDNIRFKSDKIAHLERLISTPGCRETPGCTLLDSSLISQTNMKKFSLKIIQSGNYIETYDYNEIRQRKDVNFEKIERKKIKGFNKNLEKKQLEKWGSNFSLVESGAISFIDISKIQNKFVLEQMNDELFIIRDDTPREKKIELKNILRSKFSMQRLVKANIEDFKTFITLTFDSDVFDVQLGNKKLNIFLTKIRSIKKDFKYVCVSEFQKKTKRIHYHLLTNLQYDDKQLICENVSLLELYHKLQDIKYTLYHLSYQKKELNIEKINDFKICMRMHNDKLENTKKVFRKETRKYFVFKTVRYWSYGFSSIIEIQNMDVVGYISKYMTKDIDDRLWGKRRYLYSRNLRHPKTSYIDFDNLEDFKHYVNSLNGFELNFEKIYADKFGQAIEYKEYKKVGA